MTRCAQMMVAAVLSMAIGIGASVAIRTAFDQPVPLLVPVAWWI